MADMTSGSDLETKIAEAVMQLSHEQLQKLKEYLLMNHPELAQTLCT